MRDKKQKTTYFKEAVFLLKQGVFYQFTGINEVLFSGAEAYRDWFFPGAVQENSNRYFPYSERHLQALWYDDSLRPEHLKTSRGEPVEVETAGRWNLEAGPDFRGAVLRIGREKRRVSGDAEIHIFFNDWKNHGHHSDLRYADVRFHITWFDGPLDESLFPPGTVQLSLCDTCAVDLESIDLTAYPYAEPRASQRFPMSGKKNESPCYGFPMAGKNPDQIFQTLEGAGMERMRQKTQRMAWLIRERGEAQALYEETAAALGYKNNKAPFRALARSLPLDALAQYDHDWKTVYAVLLGVSGLLPTQPGSRWPDSSKKELRSLWDCWWREQHKWEDAPRMSRSDWNLSGMRPLNHPVRRLCALAQWATALRHRASRSIDELYSREFKPSYWATHVGWTGKETNAELVGKGRLKAIQLNVTVPFRLAKEDADALKNLHVEPINSVIKETAYTLFGPDHSPQLYCSALARQGLIQIFNDFILTGRTAELAERYTTCKNISV